MTAWRLVLAETEDGENFAVGPVQADHSVEELRGHIESAGWSVTGVIRHLSRANFIAEVYRERRP